MCKRVSGLEISSLGLVPREGDRSGVRGDMETSMEAIVSISTSHQLGPSDPTPASSELAVAKVM